MANMDAFSAQLVKLVRAMPDAALLDLVKNQLDKIVPGSAPLAAAVPSAAAAPAAAPAARRRGRPPRAAAAAPAPAAPAAPAPAAKPAAASGKRGVAPPPKRRPGRPRRSAAATEDRADALGLVEQIVKAGAGMSASDVASEAKIPQTRAAAALKELKLAKRIFQGGDRRFARYAGDQKTADQASINARKNAAGPAPTTVAPPKKAAPAPAATGGNRGRKKGGAAS